MLSIVSGDLEPFTAPFVTAGRDSAVLNRRLESSLEMRGKKLICTPAHRRISMTSSRIDRRNRTRLREARDFVSTKQGRLPTIVKRRTSCHRIEHDRVRRVLRRRLQRVVRRIPHESQPQCSQCLRDSGLGERPRIFVSGQGARSRPRSVQYPASSRLCRLESQRG